jgi:hypothetical protein
MQSAPLGGIHSTDAKILSYRHDHFDSFVR